MMYADAKPGATVQRVRFSKPFSLVLLAVMVNGCGTDMPLSNARLTSSGIAGTQASAPVAASANPFSPVSVPVTPVEAAPSQPDSAAPLSGAGTGQLAEIPDVSTDESSAHPHVPVATGAVIPNTLPATPTDTSDEQPAATALSQDTPVECSSPDEHIQQRTLELINAARAEARNCGSEHFHATTTLIWNTSLLQAARAHSADMATHNFFDHTGSDGGTIGTRVTGTGYTWSTVGENIAAGQTSVAVAVQGWIDSPGHCRNLMNPAFTEVALACSEDTGSDYTLYWTNVLAVPR